MKDFAEFMEQRDVSRSRGNPDISSFFHSSFEGRETVIVRSCCSVSDSRERFDTHGVTVIRDT